jgi:aminoglycoside phosphotransferase (APT) family kinase protein
MAGDTTDEVSPGLEIDVGRFEGYLSTRIDGFSRPLTVRQFSGGQSNPTYLLTTPRSRYVLRRKPPGPLLASAHAVDREFRVIKARAHLLCTDAAVIGTWFYVMDYVDGRIFWDPAYPELERPARRSHALAVCEALAQLHLVRPEEVTLGDYGRPSGYVARQFARWSKQYLADVDAGRIAALDRRVEWLPDHLPADESTPAIVHGDYRLDNVMFHRAGPRVAAILDWELSSRGDPLADFAYYIMVYRLPSLSIPGLADRDVPALGLPTEQECVAHYCALTSRDRIDELEVHVAFSMFRLAAIFHGIRGRVMRGTAASPRARDFARHAETIADLAWRQAQRAG